MAGGNTSLTPQSGCLYVVATPIGNMSDLSERAKSILQNADLIACEDTRSTGSLLARLGFRKTLVSYHEHNEKEAAASIVEKLQTGESAALVSDAGTPGISDPGFRLVRECRRQGIPVSPIPGPSAAISLLSVSGLPTNAFLFVGFLPPKKAARQRFLEENRNFKYSIILYESCHRIEKLLGDILNTLGSNRQICVGRELTKKFETILTGPASQVVEKLNSSSKKGEFVVVVAPEGYEL